MADAIRGWCWCADCELPQEMTRHGECAACGSTAVMRRPLRAWHWLRAEPRKLQRTSVLAFTRGLA